MWTALLPEIVASFLALEASAGVGTPVGHVGLTTTYAPSPPFELAVGAGIGARGPQLSGLARVGVPIDGDGFGVHLAIGAGLSVGPVANWHFHSESFGTLGEV